jgi:hypothetical protein
VVRALPKNGTAVPVSLFLNGLKQSWADQRIAQDSTDGNVETLWALR